MCTPDRAERLGLRWRIIPRFRQTDTRRPRLLTAHEIGVECSTVSSRLPQRPATSLCFLEMLAVTRPAQEGVPHRLVAAVVWE
jgi:hypothetical protein